MKYFHTSLENDHLFYEWYSKNEIPFSTKYIMFLNLGLNTLQSTYAAKNSDDQQIWLLRAFMQMDLLKLPKPKPYKRIHPEFDFTIYEW